MGRALSTLIRGIAASLLLAGLPAVAFGLGLGEARVDSYLNQPLDVRMRLLDVDEQDLESLSVRIASPDDYQRLGLMSDALSLDLEVQVDRSTTPPVIRVTSQRIARDPVIQLLIDARWAGGRMLREYTLFLDPATVAVAPPPAEPAEPSAAPSSAPVAAPAAAARPAAPADRPVPARPRAQGRGDGRYGPVASGDTLWSIARDHLPAGDITMNQMMIAIVELNPQAFRNGNINWLLRGAELDLPDARRAREIDAETAAAAVAAQNRAFARAAGRPLPVVSAAGRDDRPDAPGRPTSSADAAATDSRRASEARLSLVPPEDGAEEGDGDGSSSEQIEELQQRLARAEEELYAARQESQEFQARVEELERVLEARRQSGAGIRDAEMAALEQTLADAREAGREGADPEVRDAMSERMAEMIDQASQSGDGGAADSAAGTGPEAAAQSASAGLEAPDAADSGDAAATPERATPAPAQAPVTTEVGRSQGPLGNPLLWGVIGLVVLVLIAAAVVVLRRRRAAEAESTRPLKRAAEIPPARPADPARAARDRVREQPADLAAHLALLETLADERRRDEFGEALEAMFEQVDNDDDPHWRKALDLAGRIVPAHGLVKGSTDWIADSGPETGPRSEVDEESDVDDLMSRLDSDLDEDDDRDWIPGESADDEPGEPVQGPLLRDGAPSDADQRDDAGSNSGDDHADEAGAGSRLASDDEDIDFSEWLADDDDDGAEPKVADTEVLDETPPARDADTEVLDEFESGDRGAAGPADAGSQAAPDDSGGDSRVPDDEDADEIFSHGDDDVEVKLDLARAYVSWNSTDSARTLLEEILREGNDEQKEEARRLLGEIDPQSD